MKTNPWLVPVTTLRRSIGNRRHEQRTGTIGALQVAGSAVDAADEVTADVVLDSVDGGVEVSGSVVAPWHGECRRCLQPVGGELVCQVREVYRPRSPGETGDDEDTYPLAGEQLDLRPLVRDAILLDLPLAPLCRADCAGLCPTCGRDLNSGACDCAPVTGDPRWAALDVLRSGESPG